VVTAVSSGKGVQKSGFGLLFTALNSPGSASVPADLRDGRERLEHGLTFTLLRRRGWYRTPDGRDVFVHRWSREKAHGDGHDWPVASTRLWKALPADHEPLEETPDASLEPEVRPVLSRETIANGRQRLDAERAQVRASRTVQGAP
jgi:hypothetical protein